MYQQEGAERPVHSPRRIYAFVDSVVEADPARSRSRMSLQLDAIDANAFDGSSGSVDDRSALLLARVSTTPNRLGQLFGVDDPKEGDWFEMKLERSRLLPRAWQLPLEDNYAPQRPMNVVGITPIAGSSELAGRLDGACIAPNARTIGTLDSLASLLSAGAKSDLRITALDVGQAACVAFSEGSRPFGYFDVGAPMFFNQRSFPRPFRHQPATDGFVILSHWDFDHFALALRYPELERLQWFAPNQPVGPNTALFQRSLGSNLNFISSDVDLGTLVLKRCSGTVPRDRNSTGYALGVKLDGAGILLPGDADYQWIPPMMADKLNRIMMPHHGAAGSPPPSPEGGADGAIAVVSYGVPNTYRHPNEQQIQAHRLAGWRIRRTAAHGSPARPRGSQLLYPI
ncbi:beta-lactamase superfamily II metal-dependent hydrolase [Bradyrhizobium sp. LB7.1]